METEIKGTGVALITTFLENSEVDYDGLERVVKHVTDGNVDYLVALGTTGETVTLTAEEKLKVFNHIVEVNNNKLPIVLGHGGNNTKSLIENLNRYDLNKVHSILSVVPPYNRPSQMGLYEHYKAFCEACSIPVILYNVPGRTGTNMEVETIMQLAEDVPNIIGVKEAGGDIMQMQRLIAAAPENFVVISGDDALAVPLISLGGVGIISVIANAFPKQMSAAVNCALNNDFSEAQKYHFELFELMNLTFADGNPGGIKAMLSHLKLTENILRLPLYPVMDEISVDIENAIARLVIKYSKF